MKIKEKVVRPGGLELPTFWFVVSQESQSRKSISFVWRRLRIGDRCSSPFYSYPILYPRRPVSLPGTGPVGPTKLLGDIALGFRRIRWWLHVFGMLALNLGPDLSPKSCAYFATVTDCVRHELRHNRGQFLLQRR